MIALDTRKGAIRMKYQITEFHYSNGISYYIAQYDEGGVWKTIDEYVSTTHLTKAPKKFSSMRSAKRELEDLYKQKKNKEYCNVVDTGEIGC